MGALTVLSAGLEELRNRPLIPPRLLEGFQDTVEVIADLRQRTAASPGSDAIDACIAALRMECSGTLSGGARATCQRLLRIRRRAADLAAQVSVDRPVWSAWALALVRQAADAHKHLSRMAFWTQYAPPTNGTVESGRTHTSPKRQRGSGLATSLTVRVGVSPDRMQHSVTAAPEQHSELKKPIASFDLLDAGCTLGQVLEAAQQIIECHSCQWDAADEDGAAELGSRRGCRVGFSPPLCEDELKTALPTSLRRAARGAVLAARQELRQISSLTAICRKFSAMDFRFLFHPRRKLLAVGFNVRDRRCDESCYDLLASEARLTSFLAVSHGQLPLEHWFALGRMVTVVGATPTLLSWSGSMFEYLLPMLIMPSYRATHLDATCRAAVKHQIRYARRRGVPWGISESCSGTPCGGDDYGYRAFGVPGLGLAPDLGERLVVAPYAAALALVVAPREACANLARLEQLGYLGPHGFYDAIDYTAELSRTGSPARPCEIVMAHHSGMTLLALAHALLGPTMPQRFLRHPHCAAHDILLQERVPRNVCPVDPEMFR